MAEETQQLPEVAPPKKKGGSKIVMIIAVAVIVLGGAGGGAWWYLRAAPAAAGDHAEPESDPSKHGLLTFEPFLVNLADAGGGRFLKTTVQVVLADAAEAAHLKEEKPVLVMQARSAILELLTVQTADALVTPEGKKALKDAIKEKVTSALGHIKVVDVLFSEFVVQF